MVIVESFESKKIATFLNFKSVGPALIFLRERNDVAVLLFSFFSFGVYRETLTMTGRGLVSRSQSVAPSSHGRPAPAPAPSSMSCNRCRKPFATTLFLCKCDCVFCEGTFLHSLHCSAVAVAAVSTFAYIHYVRRTHRHCSSIRYPRHIRMHVRAL